jgi:hypothetical protein
MNHAGSAKYSGGQAMAEFAVAVAVLVTLLLGMPVIGRYHELKVATLEGARLLAFQDSWRQAGQARPDTAAMQSALFIRAASADQPEAQQVEAAYTKGATPGRAGQAERALLAPFAPAVRLRSGFDLHGGDLHRADLRVAVSRPPAVPEPFRDIPVELSASYALLGGGWASSGPAQVASRAGGLVITHAAQSLQPLMSLGSGLLSIVEPAFRHFCPGLVDPEQIPADRLGAALDADAGPASRWVAAC